MNKISFYILLSFIKLFYFACEDSEIVDVNLSYKEYVVVRGELFADSIFSGATFTKTLPMNVVFDIKKAELKNVFAYLRVNGIQIIPLHYFENGTYKPLYDMRILAGNKYELFAEVNGKSIYASTMIPAIPQVQNSAFHGNEYADVFLESRRNECYGSVFYIISSSNNYLAKSSDFHSIAEAPNSDFNDIILSRTQLIPNEFRTELFRSMTYIQTYAMDMPYAAYFRTKGNNQPITNSFIQGGDPISWNVRGKDVIGLFIGMNKSAIIPVSQ